MRSIESVHITLVIAGPRPITMGATPSVAGHRVELPLLRLRRCQEQLLVQPVDLEELEPRRLGGEEANEKRLEELVEQHVEALVVIQTGGLRHDRLPVEPNSEGCIGLSIRTPFASERTGHCHDPAGRGRLDARPACSWWIEDRDGN
jgi:hypothetical protein